MEDFKNLSESELFALLVLKRNLEEQVINELLNRALDRETLFYIAEHMGKSNFTYKASLKLLALENFTNLELRRFISIVPFSSLRRIAVIRLCSHECDKKDLEIIILHSPVNREEAAERLEDLKMKTCPVEQVA